MNDFPEDYTLAESVSGHWHKLGLGVKAGTMLITMSEQLLLSVHISSKRLDLLLQDEKGIFQYAGDLSLEGLEYNGKLNFHSWGIEHIHLNNEKLLLDNPRNDLTNVYIKLSLNKRKETERARLHP
ncbi:hypothetical protein [Paenibacillus gansuensis]|uniref:Uncharacterized protein n=1 Tax=Paenibacillus gansuensis TaxID=306542 RepID=A0ABW5PFS0_9BACL